MKAIESCGAAVSASSSLPFRSLRALAGILGWILFVTMPGARAQTSALRFEVTRYTVDAELFPSTHILAAKTRVDFVPQADLTTLSFELHSNLRVDKVVDSKGEEARFRQDGLTLQVDFLNPISQGKASWITVNYGGVLASADGSPVENLKLGYIGPEGSYLLYPGRWFPVSGYGVNRFAATMRITVPSSISTSDRWALGKGPNWSEKKPRIFAAVSP